MGSFSEALREYAKLIEASKVREEDFNALLNDEAEFEPEE